MHIKTWMSQPWVFHLIGNPNLFGKYNKDYEKAIHKEFY